MSDLIVTLTDLAHQVGKDPGTLSRWVRRSDWPFARKGPWSGELVPQIQAWANRTIAPAPSGEFESSVDPIAEIRGLSPERRAKLQLVVERAAKIKLEREMMVGGYLKKEDVERGRVERIHAVKAELMNIRLLALKLDGNDLQAREQVLESWARNVCAKFAGEPLR